MSDFRTQASETVINAIKDGNAPWQKSKDEGLIEVRPYNPLSNKPYQKANSLLLQIAAIENGYSDPRWMTYGQAKAQNYEVKDNEAGVTLEFWQWKEDRQMLDENGDPQRNADGSIKTHEVELTQPKHQLFTVFNAEQIEGVPEYVIHPDIAVDKKAEKLAEELLKGADITIIRSEDGEIGLDATQSALLVPKKAKGVNMAEVYSETFKDLAALTGSSDRLDRSELVADTPDNNAREALRVAMAADRMVGSVGIGRNAGSLMDKVAAGHLVEVLRSDRNELFAAARDADDMASWFIEPGMRDKLKANVQLRQEAIAKRSLNRQAASSENRHYLTVPYDDRDRAKAAGAMWDGTAKCWFVDKGQPLSKELREWDVPNLPVKAVSPVKEFGNFIREQGFELEGDPIMDGGFHKVAMAQSAGVGSGKIGVGNYKGYIDGKPNGSIHIFKDGKNENIKWVATGEMLSANQRVALEAEWKKLATSRASDREVQREKAAKTAYGIWSNGQRADKDNCSYLVKNDLKGYGVKVTREGNMAVAVRDIGGKIVNLQIISPEGTTFLRGGRKEGGMHVIDPNRNLGKGPIIIAKDYADGATIHEATNRPVVVAFDVNNLDAATAAIRGKFPRAEISVAVDAGNDFEKAKIDRVAKNVGGTVIDAGSAGSFHAMKTQASLAAVQEHVEKIVRPEADRQTESAKATEQGMSV